jgi:hypothetical protein
MFIVTSVLSMYVSVSCYNLLACNMSCFEHVLDYYLQVQYIHVTDKGEEECVDSEGNGVTVNEEAEGGPGPPSGE